MKKIFNFVMIATIAACTMSLVSCNKEKGGKNDNEEKTPVYRMTSFSNIGDGWEDKWIFTYNADGTLKEANRGDADHDWLFTYSGSNVTVKLGNGNAAYDIVLDEKGHATSIKDYAANCTYTFVYDNAGFLVKGFKDGTATTEVAIQNDCIMNWTRIGETGWRYKDHTYDSAIKNLGGIHTSYSEDSGISRWMHETGLLGKGSAYICLTAQWRDRDKKAEYQYEYDANGCVTKEIKYYDGALDSTYGFTYEEVK